MYNFFCHLKCFFTGCRSLFDLDIFENFFIAAVGMILIVSLMIYPSFLIALALFLLFLWAIIF